MKQLRQILGLGVLIALVSSASAQSWLTNGLVAYYPFNGNANDASGLAPNGVLNGTGIAFSSNRFGQANAAVHLAGGGHISITPTPFNVNADFTINFWAKRDDANYSINNYFSTDWDLNGGLNIRTAASGQGLQFIEKMNGSSSYAYIQSVKPTNPYEWHSFACIKQGQNYYLYFNGVLEEWNNILGTTPDTGSLWLGRAQVGSPCDLVGAMDDVRIYNRALSSNEVAQLYNIESAPPAGFETNGLVAYYPFNGNANDASGNGYDGTPTSVTYGADRNGLANKAAQFDGISSKIKIYGFPNGNFFPITLSVFVKGLPTYASNYGIIGNYGIASANGYALSAFTDHLESLYWGSQGSVFRDNRGLHAQNTLDGKWHQVVVTYDLTGGVIYVDGVAVESLGWSGSGAASTTTHPVTIGDDDSADGTQNRVFNGSLDDIRIYNRALSSSEVARLYAIESFCSPHVAQATATMSGASVVGAMLADLGCGYTNVPSVRIFGGGGTGATAIATMENGVVTGLVVTSAGSGYTNAPRILIESPPFVPTVSIAVSKVKVTQKVRVNHHYVLEASLNLAMWTTTGPAFTAESESIVNEFDVDTVGRFFRLREVP